VSHTARRNNTVLIMKYDSQIFQENINYTLRWNPNLLSKEAVYFNGPDITPCGKTKKEAVFIDKDISLTHSL